MISEHQESHLATSEAALIGKVDEFISRFPAIDARQVNVRFTPGLCTREITMDPGNLYRSRVHKTEHQYILSMGSCLVSENGQPWVMCVSPFHGITQPGTWRLIFPLSQTRWTTMHATTLKTPEAVEAAITVPEAGLP